MPQVLTEEFKRLPLRVYTFLADMPLHDVWVVDLSCWRARVTLEGFLRTGTGCLCTPSRSCECCSTFDFRWTFLWLGSGPSGNFVGNIGNTSYRRGSVEFIGRGPDFFASSTAFENEQ